MSALGSLVVKLALEYAEYTKGLDKGSQDALKFAQGVQKNFDTATASVEEFFTGLATGALAAVGAYAGISASIDRVSHSIDLLAQLDDAAQKTGASIENLSKMQQVSEEFGHDFGQIESMLLKLSKGMATFDSETNMTNRALRTLGVESRDAAGKLRDPSVVMAESIKRLQDYEDGAAKSALAMDLFGKSGADALPVLNDLADNLDRFHGVSAEAAAQAAQFQDQLGAIRTRVDDAFISLTQGLLPSLLRITETTHDAGDGMNFFSRTGEAVGVMIERLLAAASLGQMVFSQLGDTVVTRARQFQALIKGDFHEISQLEKNLSMLRDKSLAEHQAYVKHISGGEKEIVESAAAVKKTLAYQTGTQGADEAAKKIDALNEASRKFLETLKVETLGIGATTIQTKMLAAAKQAAITPSKELRMEIMAQAQAWAKLTQFQEDAKTEFAALDAREDAFREASKSVDDYADAIGLANGAAQFEIGLIGKTGLERESAIQQRKVDLDLRKQILAIEEKVSNAEDRSALIDEAKAIAERAKSGAKLQALAKTNAEEWSRMWSTVEQTGKMAFVQLLGHGTDTFKSIGEAIKASVIDLLYQLTARKWIISIGASVEASLFPGAASAGAGGGGMGVGIGDGLSLGSSLFSALGGGLTSGLSSAVSGLGSLFGSSAVSAFGAGMGMSGTAAAGAAGAYGAAGMASTGTAITMGSAAAALAGPLAIAAIADIGLRMLAGNKTISDNKVWKTLSAIPLIGILPNVINAFFGTGPKKFGPAELTGEFLGDGFHGEFQTDWTRKLGLFGIGKKRGRRGLGIEPEQLDAVNNMLFGITDSIQEFIKSTGDQERSLDGWTFAVKHQIETEEQQAQLSLEIANSLGAYLIPELVQLQQKNETLVETMGRVRAEFTLTEQIIDLTGQTFGKVGLASLALRDSLVQHLGGLQNAGSLLQPFFEGFYTDAERAASTGRLMNAELEKLGVTIPTTREQFRAMVEAQDLNTQAGQEMFAALLRLAPAFASVTDAIGQAAAEAEAEAKRILDSMQLLTTDAFSTLFDYTKYIRLAANAGVTAAQPAQVFQAPPAQVFPSFAVGTNSLPQDMTINAHAGERIIPAADNRELMQRLREPNEATKFMADEIKQLRSELKAAHLAIARNTATTTKILSRWDGNGIPEERVTA